MEPLTLGMIVALLISKATDRTADEAIDGGTKALGRLLDWLRDRFSRDGDAAGTSALARVQEVPDSPSQLQTLAEVVDQRASVVDEFRTTLEALVAEVEAAGISIGSIVQTASGNQNVLNAGVTQSDVSVNYGTPPSATH